MEVFLARQPIFDARQKVFGYELLYRAGQENCFTNIDGDEASMAVIRNAMLVTGSQTITGGKRAFVNFTKGLLLGGAAAYLPKDIGVVEILEDVVPDAELIEAVKNLRSQGYLLALDDFILQGNENNPFLALVDIIKVDFRLTNAAEQHTIARRFPKEGKVKLLAEKTETREEFDLAVKMGYSYFQGYFFCKPVIISRKDIPGYKLNYLRLLKELNVENPSFNNLKNIIEHDPALAYKLLKYINSAFFALRHQVSSIKQALGLLGENEIRKWASLAVLMELGKEQPEELLKTSLLRARLCEQLSEIAGFGSQKSEFFFMGMFSCMDVLLGRPMEEVLEDMPIAEPVKAALLGKENTYQHVLALALAYERGEWCDLAGPVRTLKIDANLLPELYTGVLDWVEKTFQ